MKIWNTGMQDDPNPGSKRGKGALFPPPPSCCCSSSSCAVHPSSCAVLPLRQSPTPQSDANINVYLSLCLIPWAIDFVALCLPCENAGVQHMNSDYWVEAMGIFIHRNLPTLQATLSRVQGQANEDQYRFLLNQCNVLFMRSLQVMDARDDGTMCSARYSVASYHLCYSLFSCGSLVFCGVTPRSFVGLSCV
eukprot:SAG11_NODE_3_length_39220_cov_67.005828_9_plen_192_part_00